MNHTQNHVENTQIEDQGVIKMRLKVRDEHVTVMCHIVKMHHENSYFPK
jgi:hypothetical protein